MNWYKYEKLLTDAISADSDNILMTAISAISLSRRGVRKLPQGADFLFQIIWQMGSITTTTLRSMTSAAPWIIPRIVNYFHRSPLHFYNENGTPGVLRLMASVIWKTSDKGARQTRFESPIPKKQGTHTQNQIFQTLKQGPKLSKNPLPKLKSVRKQKKTASRLRDKKEMRKWNFWGSPLKYIDWTK